MEWQPTFGCSSSQQVALIQLAVTDQVFLLDVCAEGFSQHPDTVSFIRNLFSSKNVLKLGEWQVWRWWEMLVFVLLFSTSLHLWFKGYSTSGDLRCVLSTWPQFSEQPLVPQGVLDLVNVHQKVLLFLLCKCLSFNPLFFQRYIKYFFADFILLLVIWAVEVSSK